MARTSSIHVYDHFDLYLTPVTLTFNLHKNGSNGTSPPQGQQLCQTVLKSMHYCTRYGPDGRTDARKHAHTPNKIVTTMSRLPESGLDKKHFMNMGRITIRSKLEQPVTSTPLKIDITTGYSVSLTIESNVWMPEPLTVENY